MPTSWRAGFVSQELPRRKRYKHGHFWPSDSPQRWPLLQRLPPFPPFCSWIILASFSTLPLLGFRLIYHLPSLGNMFNRMRKSLSTHRSPKWTDDRFAPVMEDAERLLGNASASAPTTKRRSADREIARAPCSYTDQLNSASPAARRPSKY